MDKSHIERISAWIIQRGLGGASETELLHGFCQKCQAVGLDLSRALALIDTLHPVYEGRAFRWRNDGVEEEPVLEYGRTHDGEAAANWQRSVFYHMLTTERDEVRLKLGQGETAGFLNLETLQEAGHTDYLALVHRFASDGAIGDMDCFYSHWATSRPEGFSEAGLAAMRTLVPQLALAIKCASLTRIASTLVEVYLGRDAGQRVLSGRISRGVADRINAVLWFSDLRGYTSITDTAAPDEVIPLLNDYADAVISSIHEAGGDVLKLIGDGTLAIFKAGDPGDACRCALRAEASLRERLKILNARRSAEERPVTSVYLGLHIGDVFYGNIGSEDRLDFTVVGPAVNEVSRIASMCRSADRGVAMSSDFVAATLPEDRKDFVSLGRFALRGVGRAQELFTLDPAIY
ncbi:adenylate/guanylate cyclase domain-containing protein [Microvirga brassicacearum]|uniref:Adenylate/guanylate cyclase domain-containing protein n=1 Tax=Microvirga brassicacearum TaxID=2580413 RepID=A0A5N3P4U4_9HYPH|nr:adenylate/guanylate cyclase domain-containing protein [Microvirga brassicacearum]KAB0264742.1 adenylate/guanylate cyclase domain-containing protein [Microvirga brassicacearum]